MKRMLRFSLIFLLLLFITPTIAQQDVSGHLVIIGGGKRTPEMMKKIIELAGGSDSKIIVLPMASGDPVGTAEYQVNQLIEYGAPDVSYFICDSSSANDDSTVAKLDDVTGVFFSGGDQRRLAKALVGSKVLERIHEIYMKGGVVSGTSAGAAVMSDMMITGDERKYPNEDDPHFTTIQADNIIFTEGFGFVTEAIVDQHFIYRKRHNRLISLVLEYPEKLGIGIDESSAIIVYPNRVFEVMGEYQVIVYDGSDAEKITKDENGFLTGSNIIMHILSDGDTFNLKNKEVVQ